MSFEFLLEPQSWVALLTLIVLEVVLGIDNIIFISILSGKLPKEQQGKARMLGLTIAMLARVVLLFCISWVMSLTKPLFELMHHNFSGRDLILLFGGLFLLAKSTHEIHDKLEGDEGAHGEASKKPSFVSVLIQIGVLDMIFSLDSVITAVGMADHIEIMVIAVIVAVGFMMVFAGRVSDFVEKHPTVKMLALSFLLLIGVSLVAEAFHQEIPKGYIYFAMAFSVFVEMLNIRVKTKKGKPLKLKQVYPF